MKETTTEAYRYRVFSSFVELLNSRSDIVSKCKKTAYLNILMCKRENHLRIKSNFLQSDEIPSYYILRFVYNTVRSFTYLLYLLKAFINLVHDEEI